MHFTSAIDRPSPTVAHLSVAGELDALSSRQLRHQVSDALDGGSTTFTVDAAGVTFLDAAGIGSFVRLRNAVREHDGTLTFVSASPRFRWVCSLVGLDRSFGLEDAVPV